MIVEILLAVGVVQPELSKLQIDTPRVIIWNSLAEPSREAGQQIDTTIYDKIRSVEPTKVDPNRTQPTLRLYRGF